LGDWKGEEGKGKGEGVMQRGVWDYGSQRRLAERGGLRRGPNGVVSDDRYESLGRKTKKGDQRQDRRGTRKELGWLNGPVLRYCIEGEGS